jgi:methylglutaconyl-CoA hydratase
MVALMTAGEVVHLHVGRGVATLTLDSPSNRNALSRQLRRELITHLDTALADDSVRVLVLTHTGRVFCSGMDMRESTGTGPDEQAVNEFPRILQLLLDSPKPVVARVGGSARAGGVGIVAACDIAVTAADATFAFSEVRLGLVPAVISVTVLPRLLPRAAHELLLTGEVFDGDRAAAIGLVNSSVPGDRLDEEVTRYTDALQLGGPTALAAIKGVLRQDRYRPVAEQFADMQALSARFFAASEAQEGMRAFAEKRPPAWVAGL